MDGEEFVRRMHAGDASVWDALAPLIRRIVFGACHDLGVHDSLKDDVAQDVALRVFTHWQSYALQCSMGTWIYAIARNRCLDALRKRTVRGETASLGARSDGRDTAPPDLPAAVDYEQMLCVQQMLDALESQAPARKGSHRIIDVLRWCVENSPSTDELAAFLQTTPAAAKERKSSILKRLKELCRKFCGADDCSLTISGVHS